MALDLSDEESSRVRLNRRPRPTDSTLYGSELPSFDTNIRSNPSYGRPSVADVSFASANMVDLDDEGLYGEGEETTVRALMRRWIDERLAPDLLPWQGELVGEILERLQSQNEIVVTLQGNANTTEEEHFAVMLVQTEVERIKFVLRSYLRCRLQKIEQYTPYILATPDVQRNLSELEQNYVQRYGDLIGRHFQQTTLDQLPAHMHSLAEEHPNTPSMITEPNKSKAVFFFVRDADCPPMALPGGKSIELKKGSIHLAQYRLVEDFLRNDSVELV
ncbi:related to SLD5-part of GINS, replication multiprotein complex [Serendipita indica DSM 11827]|uniref:DNA replication complex GINS protein SLD5 n=1 Tax=Serendipita indica (strain DSM 11827) TaxID=1109443 RepID=G4TEZ5_SERID|nr:related to SLD5-part of GINS, replication multiprotein complex [Serendipita indica DSM 11827]